ncbi:hypothetical protein EIP91_009127 [Steccherinum ochraceum]|uniref:Uncharacterized protein n=1 Tax=Steccherinum ochraceum TaxID=92696 RepID=A0A4R0RA68_9APHY|nr:hypothetical protein EIP91_009127 [Steccherinum ochraceum]
MVPEKQRFLPIPSNVIAIQAAPACMRQEIKTNLRKQRASPTPSGIDVLESIPEPLSLTPDTKTLSCSAMGKAVTASHGRKNAAPTKWSLHRGTQTRHLHAYSESISIRPYRPDAQTVEDRLSNLDRELSTQETGTAGCEAEEAAPWRSGRINGGGEDVATSVMWI